jgi:hypothetical protein
VAQGTGAAAATFALLKGVRWGRKGWGAWSDDVHVEGWYGTLMSWRGGGSSRLQWRRASVG